MVTESKIFIEELQWKSAQTNDASEDSFDEIGELIYQQSRTGKARAEAERKQLRCDFTNQDSIKRHFKC